MSIQQLVDNALLKEQEEKNKRVRSGKFSPSSFGKCYRAQYWNRKNEPQTNPPDISSLRRFKVGSIIHNYIQSFFPKAQIEVKIDLPDIIGFADIVEENTVNDIKSCRTYEFKLMQKKDYNIETEKFTNCIQVCSYAYFLGKPYARLIFIEKDALDSKEYILKVSEWKDRIEDELLILRGQWEKQELPKAIPRAYNGNECKKYCGWRDKCFKIEGKEIK